MSPAFVPTEIEKQEVRQARLVAVSGDTVHRDGLPFIEIPTVDHNRLPYELIGGKRIDRRSTCK